MPPLGLQNALGDSPPRFVMVANNPLIASARWRSAPWTIVRFNDCKVDWPPRITVEAEVLLINEHEARANCEHALGRSFVERVVRVGTLGSNQVSLQASPDYADSFLPRYDWDQGAWGLSTGTSAIVTFRLLYPAAPIVAAGFSFHHEDRWDEIRSMARMQAAAVFPNRLL